MKKDLYIFLSNCCHFFQYKEDLSSDEEIFAEKTKEIESLKENVRQLEEEKAKLINQLQETQTRLKKHEDQLFQQQLQLNQFLLNQGISQGKVIHSFALVSFASFVSFVAFVSFVLFASFVSFVSFVAFFSFVVSLRSFHSLVHSFLAPSTFPSSLYFLLFGGLFFLEWEGCSFVKFI